MSRNVMGIIRNRNGLLKSRVSESNEFLRSWHQLFVNYVNEMLAKTSSNSATIEIDQPHPRYPHRPNAQPTTARQAFIIRAINAVRRTDSIRAVGSLRQPIKTMIVYLHGIGGNEYGKIMVEGDDVQDKFPRGLKQMQEDPNGTAKFSAEKLISYLKDEYEVHDLTESAPRNKAQWKMTATSDIAVLRRKLNEALQNSVDDHFIGPHGETQTKAELISYNLRESGHLIMTLVRQMGHFEKVKESDKGIKLYTDLRAKAADAGLIFSYDANGFCLKTIPQPKPAPTTSEMYFVPDFTPGKVKHYIMKFNLYMLTEKDIPLMVESFIMDSVDNIVKQTVSTRTVNMNSIRSNLKMMHDFLKSVTSGLNEVMTRPWWAPDHHPVATNLRLLNQLTGTVKSYDKVKGFGLIMPDDSAKQHVHPTAFANGVFVHATALDGLELAAGQRVSFDIDHNIRRRKAANFAINVRLFDQLTGIVTFYNNTKGYGLIKPDNGGKDVFVHDTALEKAGIHELDEGQRVSFEIMPGT